MNLILFGPPGVGKGTQASRLAASHRLLHISTGDILRTAIAEGSPLGMIARTYVESGGLVPDDIIIGLVREVLEALPSIAGDAGIRGPGSENANSKSQTPDLEPRTPKGFLLDGFPRTLEQAHALDDLFRELGIHDVRIVIITAPEEELIERMVKRGIEQGRKDDTAETIRHRLDVYTTQTEPVKTYYAKTRGVKLVDGLGSVEEVTGRIENELVH
jgi:adenylate kinase